MPLKLTPRVTVKPTSCAIVEVTFEHGDADSTTTSSVQLNISLQELEGYLTELARISQAIRHSRSTGTELARDFEEKARFKGYRIPVEVDCYAKMHMSGYYAAIENVAVTYYDENGCAFDVEFND